MRSSVNAIVILIVLGSTQNPRMRAADTANPDLERRFTQTVRPFVTTYCVGCHSGATPAAQFDLRPYSTVAAVVRDYPRWNLVLEKLTAEEMPPEGLQAAARRSPPGRSSTGSRPCAPHEARKNAGDPGPVLARRLSNAEYNYTIRDLTGVDMRPTREFPVDPANTAGFDNSGESLTMSPALLNKYLQAAREVADHMVLTPDGFDFAPHPMLVETDREKYAIQRIVDFYERQPTDYADYFQAAWRFKHRAALGKPDGDPGRHRRRSQGEPEVSADGLADPRRAKRGRGRPDRQTAGDVARPARARRNAAGRAPREMRRDARFRGPDPQAHRHAVRRPGGAAACPPRRSR